MLGGLLLAALALGAEPAEVPLQQEGVPEALAAPELLHFEPALYPAAAEAAGVEGDVLLRLTVAETGEVVAVEVVSGPGAGLEEAAAEAARALRFAPMPVSVVLEFRYGFELAPAPVAEAPVNLSGRVRERGTAMPLPGADIEVEVGGQTLSAVTDEEGRWSLRGVPLGVAQVRVLRGGYDPLDEAAEVVAGEATALDLWMRSRGYGGDEIVVIGHREDPATVTRHSISVEEVQRVPGTFGDPVRVVQSLPGAARAPFGTGLLILRGANPEDSRVYVDGVEVPIVFHLGGYRSVVNSALIDSVDYMPGGYGVRYGRATGGVVDIQSKDTYPERFTGTWRTDLLDSSAFVAGQTGGLGVAVGVRRSYIDAFIPFLVSDETPTIKPRWADYQAKVESLASERDHWSLFAFGFQDYLFVQSPDLESGEAGSALSTVYQTHRVVGAWQHVFSDTASASVQPMVGYDDVQLALGTEAEIKTVAERIGARAELSWRPDPRLTVRPGLDSSLYRSSISFAFPAVGGLGDDPLAEGEALRLESDGWTFAPDPFVDLQWTPTGEADDGGVNLGLRGVTMWNKAGLSASLDPRLAFRWAATPGGSVKGGSGLYHQPPDAFVALFDDTRLYSYERAWSTELGWEQSAYGLSADATAFYKDLSGILISNPALEDPATDPLVVPIGSGRVYGTELLLRRDPTDHFFGWVSYTLSRSERDDGDGDGAYAYDFDQTHILTAVASYRFPYELDLSGRFQYVTGTPFTPYQGATYQIDAGRWTPIPSDDRNSARNAPYWALDMRLSKVWTFKRGSVEAFVDVLNALHGLNPEGTLYNYDYTESRVIEGLPLIPSPGFQAEFTF
ncbi:MAG: TonB family protein [Deltaproteobacteria bacterium]|nr:TonB family protein [Deltaproteobacteria bacterium]